MVDVIGFNYISRVYSMIKSVVAGLLTIGAILILQKRDFNAGKFGNEPNVSQSVDTVLMGDINNYRITDTAFVIGPEMLGATDTDAGDCVNGDCSVTIRFSGRLPEIRLQSAIGAKIENLGDVNGDRISKIVIVPWWFISCWGKMHFYTLKENSWREFGEADCDVCREESYLPLIKVKRNKLAVNTFHWDEDAGDRIPVKKTIQLDRFPTNNR